MNKLIIIIIIICKISTIASKEKELDPSLWLFTHDSSYEVNYTSLSDYEIRLPK
jgi:hypothetical protein